jgi:hypothetical protein
MLTGSPKSCKRYGDGAFVLAVKTKLYTTAVTCGEGEEKQSVNYKSLNPSTRRDLYEYNKTDGEPIAVKAARWVRGGFFEGLLFTDFAMIKKVADLLPYFCNAHSYWWFRKLIRTNFNRSL